MYAKIKNDVVFKCPYTQEDLQKENPYTNFNSSGIFECFQGTEENQKGFELVEVVIGPSLQFDESIQKMQLKDNPEKIGGVWVLDYEVVNKTDDEISKDTDAKSSSSRKHRDDMLKETDWTQLTDSPVNKSAWAIYRQALRDVPSQEGFPWNIIWPTPPE